MTSSPLNKQASHANIRHTNVLLLEFAARCGATASISSMKITDGARSSATRMASSKRCQDEKQMK